MNAHREVPSWRWAIHRCRIMLLAGMCLALVACGDGDDDFSVPHVSVGSVSFDSSDTGVVVDGSKFVQARVYPGNASNPAVVYIRSNVMSRRSAAPPRPMSRRLASRAA